MKVWFQTYRDLLLNLCTIKHNKEGRVSARKMQKYCVFLQTASKGSEMRNNHLFIFVNYLSHLAFARCEQEIASLCPYISSDFARAAKKNRQLPQLNSRGGWTIIMGVIKSPLGIKRPRVKNSRSGVKVIMKCALRAPDDRYGVYLYYKRGRFVLCP